MKLQKRTYRFLCSLILSFALLLTSAFPTFAAGTEDWSNSTRTYVGSMHMTNYNLTPVKTIKRSGTLHIVGHFYGEDAHAAVSPIKLTAQIRRANGGVIGNASTVKVDNRSGLIDFEVSCPVSSGQKVQIYFDASSISNPPGYYRQAFVEYWYYIS